MISHVLLSEGAQPGLLLFATARRGYVLVRESKESKTVKGIYDSQKDRRLDSVAHEARDGLEWSFSASAMAQPR